MIGPGDEHARPAGGAGFTDAVTVSFADPAAGLYGLARLGLSPTGDGSERRASALAVLFEGREPLTAVADGSLPVPADAEWTALVTPSLTMTVDAPLERWSARFEGERHAFAIELEALSPPAVLEGEAEASRVGGMQGYEQLCRVTGSVRTPDAEHAIDGLGQRGHSWGAPDWSRLAASRTLAAWFGPDLGVAVSALRPEGAGGHDEEARWGALLGPDGVLPVADPRLSTTYDDAGHQRRAGLELWLSDDDDHPRRAAGVLLCGSTLDLGSLRLDCAFLRWHMEGRVGVGRYDVLRRA